MNKKLILLSLIFILFNCQKKKVYVNQFEGISSYKINEYTTDLKYPNEINYPYGSILEVKPNPVIKFDKNFYKVLSEEENEFVEVSFVEDSPKIIYLQVNNIDGAEIYSDKELKNLIKKVPFATEVVFKSGYNSDVYNIEYDQSQKGYIKSYDVLIKNQVEYYRILTASGLILRERPTQKSKQLDLIPLHFIGEVLGKDNQVQKISDKKGYWIYTEYNSKKGWIFSGFVAIGKNKDSLKRDSLEETFYTLFEKPNLLNSSSLKQLSLPNNLSHGNELLTNGYTFRNVYKTKPKDECDIGENYFYLLNESKKIEFEKNEVMSEGIYFEKDRILITKFQTCQCCCIFTGARFYFLLEGKIQFFELGNQNYNFYWSVDEKCRINYENAKYSSKDKSFYLYTSLPNCSITQSPYGGDNSIVKFIEYTNEVFIQIKILENNILISRFFDKSIPKEYVKSYEEAEFVFKKKVRY